MERPVFVITRIHSPLRRNTMRRRDLLKSAGLLAPWVIAGRAFAAPAAGSNRFLLNSQ
jgi:hypothetical protein